MVFFNERNKMTFIIGFAGPGHVGKSTTCKRLQAAFKRLYPTIKTTRYAFATPIYKMVSQLIDVPIATLKDELYKETPWTEETAPLKTLIGWTPRKFLQKIGTECFRNNIHEDFWVHAAIKKLKKYDLALMEDARFENEFRQCFKIIELQREGVDYLKNHPSAMPPNPEFVWTKIEVCKNINYNELAAMIYNKCYGSI